MHSHDEKKNDSRMRNADLASSEAFYAAAGCSRKGQRNLGLNRAYAQSSAFAANGVLRPWMRYRLVDANSHQMRHCRRRARPHTSLRHGVPDNDD